jgi:N,N'-diacetyllegionaminate synthase
MKIICEIGSNWKTFEDCKNAISLAKACGADAVKFQLYTHQELYGYPGKISGELPRDWISKLKNKADAVGIEFMCTAFSPEALKFLNFFVDTHKIASSEACYQELLLAAMSTEKPLIISLGAQSQSDILAIDNFTINYPVTFLYCEAAYPSRHSDLRKMLKLEETLNRPVGFSDHTTDVYIIPRLAYDYGAQVLEKHFNPFDYTDTPDAPHALNVEDFQAMVYNIKEQSVAELGPSRAEQSMLTTHKRRIKVTSHIKFGDRLEYGKNFGVYRSKTEDTLAAHPSLASKINGQIAQREYNVGDGISPGTNSF